MGFLGALLGAAPTVLAGVAKGKRDREETEYTRDQAAMKQMAEQNARQQAMAQSMQEFEVRQGDLRESREARNKYQNDTLTQTKQIADDRAEALVKAAKEQADLRKYLAKLANGSGTGLSKIPVGVQGEIMGGANAISNLNHAIGRFDEVASRYMDSKGKLGDMTQVPGFGITNILGGARLKNFAGLSSPEEKELRGYAADLASMKITDRSGKAVTAKEFPRLEPFIPNLDDKPEEVYRKLKDFRRIAQEEFDLYQSTYSKESGFRPLNVTPNNFTPTPPKPAGSVRGMLDAMRKNPTP